MTSSFLPDINVWVALHFDGHRHHHEAVEWFRSLSDDDPLVFCRHTQIGLFRLLTTDAVMCGEPLTQMQCWAIYSRWIDSGRASFGGYIFAQVLGGCVSRRVCGDCRAHAGDV